jgi:peptidyl-prolyl cis-trans isomerase C
MNPLSSTARASRPAHAHRPSVPGAALPSRRPADAPVPSGRPASPWPSRLGGLARGAWREPALHLAIAGALLAWLGGAFRPGPGRYLIAMGDEEQERLAQAFLQEYGSVPTEAQLRDLEEKAIREEIEYREGVELGLDKDDAIVRRRVAQKFAFLQQDRVVPGEPGERELRERFAAHRAEYQVPPRATFTHVFFSAGTGGWDGARARAEEALAELRASGRERAPERGDAFPDSHDYASLDEAAIARVFGPEGLARAVFEARIGEWAGPFRSGFGWHLARVAARETPVSLFPEVREKVREDWKADYRRRADERAFAALRARYEVSR